ncbi:hypothetical protein [Nocardiopsis coralliicola]
MAPALQIEDKLGPTRDEPDEQGPAPDEIEAPEPDDEPADDGPDWA